MILSRLAALRRMANTQAGFSTKKIEVFINGDSYMVNFLFDLGR